MDQATAGIPLNHSEQLIGEIPHFLLYCGELKRKEETEISTLGSRAKCECKKQNENNLERVD